MYSDAKIVKKKIKVNRINTVQISAQVKGSDVVKFFSTRIGNEQRGIGIRQAAVDYNTLPAIKVTCSMDQKNLPSSQNHGGYQSVYEQNMSALYQKLGQDPETCLFAGKSNGDFYLYKF